MRLDLGGDGIRGIEADAEGGFWIVAGESAGNRGPSRVPGRLKAEGVARTVVGGQPVTVVLCDTSQYVLLD